MNKNSKTWMFPVFGSILFTAAAHGQTPPPDLERPVLDSTNRISLSLRFSLNIHSKFSGIGGGSVRRTPEGNAYNYDDGYVLTDVSGNFGGQSWYWGYDNASQVNTGNNTITFNRTSVAAGGSSAGQAGDSGATPGFEIAYDRQFGVKEDWHHLRYGLEAAFNYLPVSMNDNSTLGAQAARQTDVYGYTPGTTPPSNPYQGSYNGPGFVINVPPISSSLANIPNATVTSHDDFSANLFGVRFGPYLELPFGQQEQFTVSFSAGLATGLILASESWKQNITIPGGSPLTNQGDGNNVDVMWGGYAALNASYQVSRRWGVQGGVQFEDLGTYDHSFNGRKVMLDLSQSVYFVVGASYSF